MGIRDGIKEFFSSKDDMDYPDSYYDHRILTDPYGRTTTPVMEMRVPLCCDNCEKKVRETLEDMSGVKAVDTDRDTNRVTVTGFVDPVKALRRVKKLKAKSELHGTNTYIDRTSHAIDRIDVPHRSRPLPITEYVTNPLIRGSSDYERGGKVHYVASPATVLTPVGTPGAPQLVRVNSYGRRGMMNRLNSFGRVEPRYDRGYDGDYARREHALVPALDLQGRDFYSTRRMPSLGRHRYHDAEYISMGDEFHPALAETRYVSAYNQRPSNAVYRSQVSFSKLPVTNPHYMKHLEHEYNY